MESQWFKRLLSSGYEAVSALALHDVEGFFVGVGVPFVPRYFTKTVDGRKVFEADEFA